MAEKLPEPDLRVFRVLIDESQIEDVNDIRVELTKGKELTYEEVEDALKRLGESGYAEEVGPDRWRHTQRGYGVHRSLLGLPLSG